MSSSRAKRKQESNRLLELRQLEAEINKLDADSVMKKREGTQYREFAEFSSESSIALQDRVAAASQELAERNARVEQLMSTVQKEHGDTSGQPMTLDELWVSQFSEALDEVLRDDDEALQNEYLNGLEDMAGGPGGGGSRGVQRCPSVVVHNALLVNEKRRFKVVPGCTFDTLLQEVVRFWGLEPEKEDKATSDVFTLTDEGGSMFLQDSVVLDELSKESEMPSLFLSPKRRVPLNKLKAFKPKFENLGADDEGAGGRRGRRGAKGNGLFDGAIRDKRALLRDFFIYIIWFVAHVLNLFMRRDVQGAFFIADNLNQTVASSPFGLYGDKTFLTMEELDDFWDWAGGPLQQAMFPRRFYNGSIIETGAYTNFTGPFGKVAGGLVRFRQVRVKPDCGCALSFTTGVKDMFGTCYGHYTKKCRSKEEFGQHNFVPPAPVVNMSALSPGPSPVAILPSPAPAPANETAITYNLTSMWRQGFVYADPTGVVKDSSDEVMFDSAGTKGVADYYDGSGFYVDIPLDILAWANTLAQLRANKWLDEQTRAVVVQYNVFNPNYNVYCAVKQVLEYLPCGKVITSSRYDVLKLAMYESTGDKLYGILDAVLMLLSGYFVWMQVQYYKAGKAAVRARLPEGAPDEDIRRQALKAHFSTVWNWIDVPVIVLYLAGRAMWLLMYLSSKRQELKPAEDKFYDLTDLAYRYRQSYALDGMVVLLLCVKFFKYFKLNPRLNT
eukprot:g4087.t1